MEGLAVTSERAPTRCPYCKDALDPSKELVACAPCGARHHASCHAAHGRCASCGSAEVLVPARRRPRREVPPEGSTIRVEQRDGTTTYSWDPRTKNDLILIWLFFALILTIPLALLFLRFRRKHTSVDIVVTPDEVEFTAMRKSGITSDRVRARRGDVGAVRAQSVAMGDPTTSGLTIDVGIERHMVMTGIVGPALKAPEVEWLAEQLCAWRDEV